jgi:hypothetical protein
MKRIMFGLAITGLMGIAAVSNAGTGAYDATAYVNAGDSTKAKEETPVFSSPEANKGVAEFKKIMETYGPLLAKNDTTAIKEFGTKMQEWSAGVQTWITNLSPEEQQKIGTYLEAISKKYVPEEAAGVK